jgi:hypothetical protein
MIRAWGAKGTEGAEGNKGTTGTEGSVAALPPPPVGGGVAVGFAWLEQPQLREPMQRVLQISDVHPRILCQIPRTNPSRRARNSRVLQKALHGAHHRRHLRPPPAPNPNPHSSPPHPLRPYPGQIRTG